MQETSDNRKRMKPFSKKHRIITLVTILLAFVLGGALVTLPQKFAAEAAFPPHLLVIPSSANYSPSILMRVAGTYFPHGQKVYIYWNYTGPGTGTLEGTQIINPKGEFVIRFPMPLEPTGTYTSAAVVPQSNLVLTGTTHILPQLYVIPRATGPGSVVHIYGNAFGANENVNLYWDYTSPGSPGTLITTVAANATGSFTVPFTVPTSKFWNIPIAGVGQTSGAVVHYGFILYQPLLTLAPLSGSANTSVTVSAFGFQAIEKVSVFWNGGSTPVASATTSQSGYLAPLTFTIPSGTAPGSYQVKAVGTKSALSITNTFTVAAPASTLGSTSGPVGSSVALSGAGYAPGETVNVQWNYTGPATGTTVATATAGPSGAFSTSFIVPTATTGSYPVAAVGASSQIVTNQSFTVANSLAVAPATDSPGANVTASGTGFQPGETVQFYLDSTSGTVLTSAPADGNGNISTPITLPASITPGVHQVVGVGQSSTLSFSTNLTIDTSWSSFGFNPQQTRLNPAENGVNNSNVNTLLAKWSATSTPLQQQSPVYAGGSVYIGTQNGILNAYSAATGSLEWSFNTHTSFWTASAPLVDPANNLVFFGTVDFDNSGNPSPFYALNATTGALVWSIILPWDISAPSALASNAIYIGTSSGAGGNTAVYSLNELTGSINWKATTAGSVWGAMAVDTGANMVFAGVGNPKNEVIALNATTGSQIWAFPVPNSDPTGSVHSGVVVNNGSVFVDSGNGNVYAINESNGAQIWSAAAGPADDGNVSSPSIGANGTLYVGSMDGNLYAFNSTNGTFLWKTSTGAGIASSPAVANGVVYFASLDKNIYAIDASTGSILWQSALGGTSYSSPVMANGWLYCAATNGKLYSFSL